MTNTSLSTATAEVHYSLSADTVDVPMSPERLAQNLEALRKTTTIKPVSKSIKFVNGKERGLFKAFSPALATFLNEKHPDINGALIITQFAKWNPLILREKAQQAHSLDGIPAAYMKVQELQAELPWMSVSTLYDAIHRLEKRIQLQLVGREVRCVLPPAFKKKYGMDELYPNAYQKGWILFKVMDAERYGVLKACILHNLDYQIEHFHTLLRDKEGNFYGRLSPSKITLPFNRSTISSAISGLVDVDKALVRAISKATFYRRNVPSQSVAKLEKSVAKLEATVAKPESYVGITGNRTCNSSESVCKDSHESSATDRENRASHMRPSGEGFVTNVSAVSQAELEKAPKHAKCLGLMDLITDAKQQAIASSEEYEHLKAEGKLFTAVDDDGLFYDTIGDIKEAAWVEFGDDISWEEESPAFHLLEVEGAMKEITIMAKRMKLPHTKKDLEAVRQLFFTYPGLKGGHIKHLLWALDPDSKIGKHPLYMGRGWRHKPGTYDLMFWSRKIKTLKAFVRYFRQYYVEMWIPLLFWPGDDTPYYDNSNGENVILTNSHEIIHSTIELADATDTRIGKAKVFYDLHDATAVDCQILFEDEAIADRMYNIYIRENLFSISHPAKTYLLEREWKKRYFGDVLMAAAQHRDVEEILKGHAIEPECPVEVDDAGEGPS